MAWLTGWAYRKSITLSRASGAVTNYQMKLLVGESSGATGENVDCGGLCLSTFNDLRFTAADGTTLLDYWIESITGTTPNQLATIWIEFNSIGTGDTTFYLYYGHSDAAAYSNGANTFLFFDDFPGSSIDTGKWNVIQGDVGVGSGILTLTGTASTRGLIESKTSISQGAAWRAKWKSDTNKAIQGAHIALRATGDWANRANDIYGGTGTDQWTLETRSAGTATTAGGTLATIADYHVWDGTWTSGKAKLYADGNLLATNTTNVPSGDSVLTCYEASASGYNIFLDFALVRQYAETEPAWGAWGAQEDNPAYYADISDTITITDAMDGVNPTIYGDTSETTTLTDAVDGYGPWVDSTSEATTLTDEMVSDVLKESIAETATILDEMTGQSMTDGVPETVTLTDAMGRIYEIEREVPGETFTLTDLMECLHLVDGITEDITFLEYTTGAMQDPHRRKAMRWNIQNKHLQIKFSMNQTGKRTLLLDCAIHCGRIRREDAKRFVHIGQHVQLKMQHNVGSETIQLGTLSMQVNRINNPSAAPRDVQSVRYIHQGSHIQLIFRHYETGKTILLKSEAMTCNRTNNPP